MNVFTCWHISQVLEFKKYCCSSCHIDAEEYGYSLCDWYRTDDWKNGDILLVCCAINNELKEMFGEKIPEDIWIKMESVN